MALVLAALSQSSTDTMVALQKKQSLLFIRCWLMQALQEGRGGVLPYCVLLFASPSPWGPLTCRICDHKAGTQQRWGGHSRWGRGPLHWWATEWRVGAGCLYLSWCLQIIMAACASGAPHSPGRQQLPGQTQRSGEPTSVPPGPAPQH